MTTSVLSKLDYDNQWDRHPGAADCVAEQQKTLWHLRWILTVDIIKHTKGVHSHVLYVSRCAEGSTDCISYYRICTTCYQQHHKMGNLDGPCDTNAKIVEWNQVGELCKQQRGCAVPAPKHKKGTAGGQSTGCLTKAEASLLFKVVWYDILDQVNCVSKLLQSAIMQLDEDTETRDLL